MTARWLTAAAIFACVPGVRADDVLRILSVDLDRPTLHALGVQVLISDDDDRDANTNIAGLVIGFLIILYEFVLVLEFVLFHEIVHPSSLGLTPSTTTVTDS